MTILICTESNHSGGPRPQIFLKKYQKNLPSASVLENWLKTWSSWCLTHVLYTGLVVFKKEFKKHLLGHQKLIFWKSTNTILSEIISKINFWRNQWKFLIHIFSQIKKLTFFRRVVSWLSWVFLSYLQQRDPTRLKNNSWLNFTNWP